MIWFMVFTSVGLALSLRLIQLKLSLRSDWRGLFLSFGTLAACAWLAPWLDGIEITLLFG